jgi:hypothetical protein
LDDAVERDDWVAVVDVVALGVEQTEAHAARPAAKREHRQADSSTVS